MVFVGSFSSTSDDMEEPLPAIMSPTLNSDQAWSVILHKRPTRSYVCELEVRKNSLDSVVKLVVKLLCGLN